MQKPSPPRRPKHCGQFAAQINSSNLGLVATVTTAKQAGDATNPSYTGLEIQGNITSGTSASDPTAAGKAANIIVASTTLQMGSGADIVTATNDTRRIQQRHDQLPGGLQRLCRLDHKRPDHAGWCAGDPDHAQRSHHRRGSAGWLYRRADQHAECRQPGHLARSRKTCSRRKTQCRPPTTRRPAPTCRNTKS